jgi:chromosome segregation ATPase
MKPTSRKKSKASKPQMQTVLTVDDIDLIIVVVSDTSEDILQRSEEKQETMYERIEAELRGVQQALHSSRAVSTAPPPSEETELGDEPAQLHRIADATEAHLRHVQEEKEQATEALKQVQEEVIEKRRVAQQEKDDLQAKFTEDRAQIQQEKEQLLAEQVRVKEAVNRALHSVTGLEKRKEDPVENQVAKLVEAIQQLQQRIADLELQTVPSTLQDVRDQREATARSAVERIKALALECKQLSSRSAQTYERLTEDPELKTLESQLQEAKQQATTVQAQLKLLSAVERMKRSQEQCTCSTTGPCHTEKSHGSDSEAPASPGCSLPTF